MSEEKNKKRNTKKDSIVYILECKDGSLYTGWTNDLEQRIRVHNSGKGAKYTRGRGPVRLVYHEKLESKEAGLKREKQIQNMTRDKKIELISNYIGQ